MIKGDSKKLTGAEGLAYQSGGVKQPGFAAYRRGQMEHQLTEEKSKEHKKKQTV